MSSIKNSFKYLKFGDFAQLFLAALVFPLAIIAKIFIRNFWLVCETKYEARDNGYWFYKWVRENRPKQKIAYAVSKKSPDYGKVKSLGKVIGRGTPAHWFWYIVADKNISSQKHGKPNAAVCYLFEVILGLRKNNRVFLQHGVTKDDMPWCYYDNTKFRLFITSAQPEQEYIADNYGYPTGNVKMCGFARFDSLHNAEPEKDLILVMPTWREWLGRESKDNRHADFRITEYYKKWNGLLNDRYIAELLDNHDLRLLFYPHRNMQKFLSCFSTSSARIEIADWRKYDIQDVLKRAAVMVTDYSSVFFDFAYMRKPVIFYQFDESEFRSKQYKKGYFDYHNTVLGEWCGDRESVIDRLKQKAKTGFELLTESAVREFFPLWDENNSQRIYDAIIDLKVKRTNEGK